MSPRPTTNHINHRFASRDCRKQPIQTLLRRSNILVTGGTGYLGRTLVATLLKEGAGSVRILSRNRSPQKELIQDLRADNLDCVAGDVRDSRFVRKAVDGMNIVIHAAAMKSVEACEARPRETIATNLDGTANVLKASLERGVSRALCLSTLLAVQPQTVYGASKLLVERLVGALSETAAGRHSVLACVRLPSILGSTGSVFQIFEDQIRKGSTVTITNAEMTRFMVTRSEASNVIIRTLFDAKGGEVFVPKCRLYRIVDLARALMDIHGKRAEVRSVGTRIGEPIHEAILNQWEAIVATDIGYAYVIPKQPRDKIPHLKKRVILELLLEDIIR